MSDWVMRDWRVPPRVRYAMAFLVAAIAVSSSMMGASMLTVPSNGEFDDGQMLLVADNRLSAVEALWVDPPDMRYSNLDDDLPDIVERNYPYLSPTEDPTVRWLVRAYFELEAERKEVLKRDRGVWADPEQLGDDIDYAFLRITARGSYCAWELRFNGTRVHFGSDTVEHSDLVPETAWTVAHDYSGSIEWPSRDHQVPFHARLVLHIWYATERPQF